MEDKILKFATAVVVVLTVAVCIGLPFFPQIHTWAVESREERLAEEEYVEKILKLLLQIHQNRFMADSCS